MVLIIHTMHFILKSLLTCEYNTFYHFVKMVSQFGRGFVILDMMVRWSLVATPPYMIYVFIWSGELLFSLFSCDVLMTGVVGVW